MWDMKCDSVAQKINEGTESQIRDFFLWLEILSRGTEIISLNYLNGVVVSFKIQVLFCSKSKEITILAGVNQLQPLSFASNQFLTNAWETVSRQSKPLTGKAVNHQNIGYKGWYSNSIS